LFFKKYEIIVYIFKLCGVLGKGIESLILSIPVIYIKSLSKPKPKPVDFV
jgi:hypothetical protein